MVNDFERSDSPKHPVIERIKDTLYEAPYMPPCPAPDRPCSVCSKNQPISRRTTLFSDCFLWEATIVMNQIETFFDTMAERWDAVYDPKNWTI